MTSERQARLRMLGPEPDPPRMRQLEAGRHRRARERRASYHEVFAVREFRWLWTAQVLSNVGDQFAQVAIAILVYGRTGSAFLTALVYALTYLPPIAGGPLLSGLADVFPRRRVMVLCDLIRMGTVGLMAIPGVPLPVLCVLLFGAVLLGAPFGSARSALLPDVLTSGQLTVGTAIGNITHQASQILGFVAGAAVVATLDPYRTLGIDALTFGVSAFIAFAALRARPAAVREPGKRPSMWSVSADGIRIVFGSPVLRNLLLFGWLAGFYIVPEGLAAPYAHSLHGTALTVGLLMAAMPLGTVIGAVLFGRLVGPSEQIRAMGWLAMASCAPLIGSAWNPPLGVVLVLWGLAGVGGAFQLAAVPAFIRALEPGHRARAFGVAQSGLYAVQGLGILAGGAAAEAIGAPMAVSLAGLLGLCAATGLAMSWSQLRGKVIADQRSRELRPVLRQLATAAVPRGLRSGPVALLVDEGLRYRGVLPFLWDDGPRDQVRQDAEPVEDGEDPEREPDQVHVDSEVRREPGADPGDHPALPAPDEPFAPAAVVFGHVYDDAHSGRA